MARAAPPAEAAEAFVARINEELAELGRELSAAGWVRATYITKDTALLQSRARERYAAWHSDAVKQAMQTRLGDDADDAMKSLAGSGIGRSLAKQAIEMARERLGSGHALTGEVLQNHAVVLGALGRTSEAIAEYEEAMLVARF